MQRKTQGDDQQFVALVQALRLVAEDAEAQVHALDTFRDIATEMASGDTPVVLLDRKLMKEGILPETTASIIREIDSIFDQMLRQEQDVLIEESLREDPRWKKLRQLARAALASLGASD